MGRVSAYNHTTVAPLMNPGYSDSLKSKSVSTGSVPSKVNGVRELGPLKLHGRKSKRKKEDALPSLGELIQTQSSGPTDASLQMTDVSALLLQGLRSNDRDILDRVFRQTPPTVVVTTVEKLSPVVMEPLVEALVQRILKHPRRNHLCIQWLQCVCETHLSVLCTSDRIQDILQPIRGFLGSQFGLYHRVNELHGRLCLLSAQVSRRDSREKEECPANQRAPSVYVEESDEEEEQLGEGVVMVPSEAEVDFWEEDGEGSSGSEEEEEEGVSGKETSSEDEFDG